MRTIRLFSLLDHLRGRRLPISAEVLAEQLGVSVRTIYRDIKTLQSMGAPIRGEGGVGYQIEDGFFLPPLHFQPEELDVLVLGIRMAAARGDEDVKATAQRLLGKIEKVLKGDDELRDRPLLAVGTEQSADQASGMSALNAAIRERKKIRLDYENAQAQRGERLVRPLGLTSFEKVWVLTAWCELKNDFRNFRLDRIAGMKVMEETFKPERGKEFADYIRRL